MSRVVEREISELLDASEEAGSCLVVAGREADRVRRALARRVASGRVVSPARGLFVRAELWEGLGCDERTLFLARGLQALHPGWVFCGPTAAVAYGVDVSWSLQGRVHVATTRAGHYPSDALVHRHAVLPDDAPLAGVEVAGGLRVTAPERTVYDCLRSADFARGLGVADSALRLGVVDRGPLEAFVRSVRRDPRGRERALGTLAWADPRSENGGESIARARMLQLGYACPELQVEVPRPAGGGRPFRADFCWVRADGLVILGELDGTDKYLVDEMTRGRTLDEVLSDESVRGSRITLYDVSVMRFRFELTGSPARFSALLDEYGVPRRGSALAQPEGAHVLPDWDALRRRA